MNYTIFTHNQITPATVTRPGAQGGTVEVENPERPALPPGGAIFYQPDNYNRFSANAADRMLLLSDPAGSATMDQINAAFPLILDSKYNALWTAAHEWEQRHISGVGLSILSLGVAQGKPKSLAVANWSQQLWALYYQRKIAITLESTIDLDFEPAGQMPFSVPELSAEIFA